MKLAAKVGNDKTGLNIYALYNKKTCMKEYLAEEKNGSITDCCIVLRTSMVYQGHHTKFTKYRTHHRYTG